MVAVAVLATAGLLTAAGSTGAQPQPTLSQAQAKLKQLNYKENWLTQRYDQATQDLASARQRLALVNREVTRDMAEVGGMRDQIASIASNVYENGSMTSPAALLTSGDPGTLLSQSAFLTHLSSDNYEQLQAFLTTDRQLIAAREMAKRTEAAVAALQRQLAGQRRSLNKLVDQQKTLVESLTPAQRAVATGGGGSSSKTSPWRVVHRPDRHPGGEGGRVRLRSARLSLRLRRHRPLPGRVRLLRADHDGVGLGRRLDPAHQLRAGDAAVRIRV